MKSKLLLINPWQTYDARLESEFQSYIPYGLACIASIGLQCGFETRIIDCLEDETTTYSNGMVRFGKTVTEVEQIVCQFKPDIVGISSTFSMFERDATQLAHIIKKIDSSIIVILGGVTATIPSIYEPLLLQSTVYDIMVRGEGEETFMELLNNFDPHKKVIRNLKSIDGIAYKENGIIITTNERKFICNLDILPFPALDLLNIEKIITNKYYSRWRNNPKNKRSMPIFTSRGCPYNCCFCSVHSQVGYKHRVYSINYVIELMKICINNYGINHFHFEDDNLTLDLKRAKNLFKEVSKLHITWDTPNGVRADRMDDELIKIMIKSGLVSLSIAAESGNEDVRFNIVHKNLKTADIIKTAELCDINDLPCIVFFVLGFPGETMKEIQETIKFGKFLSEKYNTINMIFMANPLPGTELNITSKKNGYIKKELDNFDYFVAIRANQAPIIATPFFTKRQIFEMVKKELEDSNFEVHNVSQPMYWINSTVASERAHRVFPRMSNRKVEWEWIDLKNYQ